MPMPKLTVICGFLLVAVGIAGSIVAMTMVAKWWYALIPALIGIPLIVCGWVAPKSRKARMISMPVALLIAVVGVIGSFMPSGLSFSEPGSVGFVSSIFRLLTIIICAVFIIICVRSILGARKTRAD